MHGLGNDYLFVDGLTQPVWRLLTPAEVRALSDRHRGFGSDGVIAMLPPETPPAGALLAAGDLREADVAMRIWNRDGSEGEMCGNGLRCVVKYVCEAGVVERDREAVRVATGAGVLTCWPLWDGNRVTRVRERMGIPAFPVVAGALPGRRDGEIRIGWRRETGTGTGNGAEGPRGVDRVHDAIPVSIGNPHLVLFDPGSDGALELSPELDGPVLERHPLFPAGVNVGFARVLDPAHAVLRVWERGSGLTEACGTGAAALLAAGIRTGRLRSPCRIDLPGGTLDAEWPGPGEAVDLTGSAARIGVCIFDPAEMDPGDTPLTLADGATRFGSDRP